MDPKPQWRAVKGSVPIEQALEEYERAKARLPEGTRITIEDLDRPWLGTPREARIWKELERDKLALMRACQQAWLSLGASWRVNNAMSRNGIYPAKARQLSDKELRRVRNIGPKALAEIRRLSA